MGWLLVVVVLIGLIPARIASDKGANFVQWWIFGALLFIVALPAALPMKPDTISMERAAVAIGLQKKCLYCAELIKAEARVCRYCGRDNEPPVGSPATTSLGVDEAVTLAKNLARVNVPVGDGVAKLRASAATETLDRAEQQLRREINRGVLTDTLTKAAWRYLRQASGR